MILLVDDAEAVRITYGALLEDDGHRVIEAASLAEARLRIADAALEIDLVLVDLHLPDGLGTDLTPQVRSRRPAAPIVLLSGADHAGGDVDLVISKGSDPAGLAAALEAAIAQRAGRR